MAATLIGLASSLILLLTISRQVYTQWKSKATSGLSRWLFIGQLAASIGFVIYSWMLQNWIFLTTNVMLVVAAVVGQVLYLRNRRRNPGGQSAATGAKQPP
jgi:MtN3 and saliva related transmembrane protein